MTRDTDTTYNGWANYATWRVNLEVFDGFDPDGTFMTAHACEDYVTEAMDESLKTDSGMGAILSGWVNAFLSDVDWQEIADHINEAYELTDPDAEEIPCPLCKGDEPERGACHGCNGSGFATR